ncbi:hypothetical protein EJB05_12586, partial [Eragrostis curvula]
MALKHIPSAKMAQAENPRSWLDILKQILFFKVSPRSWSDLPTELAGLVLCRLPAYSDRVRFGAVCRHWSFSAKEHRLPPPFPCLAFPDGTFTCLPHGESFQFRESTSYQKSCGKWLVFTHDGTCSLKNPFSKTTVTLPNLSCLCPIDDEPVEIINGLVNPEEEMPQESLNLDAEISIDKVIVCSELLVAAIVKIGPLNTIALCQPGADSWFVSGLGRKRDLLAIDVCENKGSGKLSISRIECLIEGPPFNIRMTPGSLINFHHYLLESNGALLLVCRSIIGIQFHNDMEGASIVPLGIDFEIFEEDFSSLQWMGVTSVGDDQALFVCKTYSQSVCVSQYKLKGGMPKGNCILFLDDGTSKWFWKGMTGFHAIYDLSDGKTYAPSGSFKGTKGQAIFAVLFTLYTTIDVLRVQLEQ